MKSSGRASPPAGRGGTSGRVTAADSERGSLTLMLAVLFVALIAMAGIVVDGGTQLDAAQNAAAAAQEAARAGAGMINLPKAYSSGSFRVARDQAISAAQQYLAQTGYQGTASAAGLNSIRVTVRVTKPTKILSIIGIDSITATGSATASLVAGVTGPGT